MKRINISIGTMLLVLLCSCSHQTPEKEVKIYEMPIPMFNASDTSENEISSLNLSQNTTYRQETPKTDVAVSEDDIVSDNSVSDSCISDNKISEKDEKPELIIPEIKDIPVVFVGDSRFVGMQIAEPNNIYICKGSQAYPWLISKEVTQKIDLAAQYADIFVFNLGVNGFYDPALYVSYLEQFSEKYPDKTVFYMSINPIDDEKAEKYGYKVRNEQVEVYNEQFKAVLSENVTWIDTYSILINYGFDTFDGIHYTADTYKTIYGYTIGKIAELTETEPSQNLRDLIEQYQSLEQTLNDDTNNDMIMQETADEITDERSIKDGNF